MKLLICSSFVPYDAVPHAGGQTHNFYLKRIIKETSIDVQLVTFASNEESEKIDLHQYASLKTSILYLYGTAGIVTKIFRKILNKTYHCFTLLGINNLVDGYGKYKLRKELRRLKKTGYSPDVIELNWTQIIYLTPMIRKIFPFAKYYAVEQDVTFLRFEREFELQKKRLKRTMAKLNYKLLKKKEISILKTLDMIFVFSNKDKYLLQNIPNVYVLMPYFKAFSFPLLKKKNNTILFYGAMSRPENYLSAIWFIEHVFAKMQTPDLIFTVLGSNPPPQLLAYQNNRVIITGYQEDITPWFEHSLCLVAPLQLGAGIKVKILEALSAGMVILASDVASEGIVVTDTVEYFRCNSPEDYINKINMILNNPDILFSVGVSARNFMANNYDLDKSFNYYIEKLYSLAEEIE
jgi:glycosyltransferase involved in cell wall biosynthesis